MTDFDTELAKTHGAQPVIIFTFYWGEEDSYEVPQEDIYDAGSLMWTKARDFSDLNASDHTLTLINADNKYTPGHANFIFADPQYYYQAVLYIELAFRLTSTTITDTRVLYQGVIQEWGPAAIPSSDDKGIPTVEIYTQDRLYAYMDQTLLGTPDALGNPQPLVYGQIMSSADQVSDSNPETAVESAMFEGGAVTGADAFDSATQVGTGTMAINSTYPYDGTYCARAAVSAAGDTGYGNLAMGSASDVIQVQYKMRLETIPAVPINGNLEFGEILDSTGTRRFYFELLTNYKVRAHIYLTGAGWSAKDLDWYLNDYQGAYCTISVVLSKTDKYVKIYVENTEVLSWTLVSNLPYGDYKTVRLGFYVPAAEGWVGYFDNVLIYDSFAAGLYQIPGGGAYDSIDGVWVDGAVVNYDTSGYSSRAGRRRYIRRHWLSRRYGHGKAPNVDLVTYHPEYGGVSFSIDVNNTVFLLATKDTTIHPVDVLTALFTEAYLDGYIDVDSFAAAKAVTPDYLVGCVFDNISCLDAVVEVASKCLFGLSTQIPVKLVPYLGAPPASVVTLTDADLIDIRTTDQPREVINKWTVKYGWYEHDNRSWVLYSDLTSIGYIGEKADELSLEWGESCATNSKVMAETVGDLLVARLSKAPRMIEVTGRLNLATLLLGQGVTIDSDVLGRDAEVFELMEMEVQLQEWSTTLKLYNFDIPAAPA